MKENQVLVSVLLASIGLVSDPEEGISLAELDVQDPDSADRQIPGALKGSKKEGVGMLRRQREAAFSAARTEPAMDSISSVLFTLYRGTPQHGEWMIACLEGAWPALVGERVAQVCRPLIFDESCLVIEITDPAWEAAIKGMIPELLDKIRTGTCGEVRLLDFRVVPVPT